MDSLELGHWVDGLDVRSKRVSLRVEGRSGHFELLARLLLDRVNSSVFWRRFQVGSLASEIYGYFWFAVDRFEHVHELGAELPSELAFFVHHIEYRLVQRLGLAPHRFSISQSRQTRKWRDWTSLRLDLQNARRVERSSGHPHIGIEIDGLRFNDANSSFFSVPLRIRKNCLPRALTYWISSGWLLSVKGTALPSKCEILLALSVHPH